MPGIRRLQKGYKPIGALYSREANTEKIRYCQRCEEMFQIHARLGPRIMPLDDATGKPIPQPSDYDLWLECRNCGTVFPKHETKVEPILEPIVVLIHLVGLRCRAEKEKKRTRRGHNPRIKQRDEIKDEDLKRELKEGAQLISYSSTDPI